MADGNGQWRHDDGALISLLHDRARLPHLETTRCCSKSVTPGKAFLGCRSHTMETPYVLWGEAIVVSFRCGFGSRFLIAVHVPLEDQDVQNGWLIICIVWIRERPDLFG